MGELQAAVMLAQLTRQDEIVSQMRNLKKHIKTHVMDALKVKVPAWSMLLERGNRSAL